MSNTPRTDARTFRILSSLQSGTEDVVHAEVAKELELELAEAQAEKDALKSAAQGVIDRWDSPRWKEEAPTAESINALRCALQASMQMEGWQPIDIAPKDNKRPLMLAQFDSSGHLLAVDYNGIWHSDSESWEIPELYWYWQGENDSVEEPTHWTYQPPWFDRAAMTSSPSGAQRKEGG